MNRDRCDHCQGENTTRYSPNGVDIIVECLDCLDRERPFETKITGITGERIKIYASIERIRTVKAWEETTK